MTISWYPDVSSTCSVTRMPTRTPTDEVSDMTPIYSRMCSFLVPPASMSTPMQKWMGIMCTVTAPNSVHTSLFVNCKPKSRGRCIKHEIVWK